MDLVYQTYLPLGQQVMAGLKKDSLRADVGCKVGSIWKYLPARASLAIHTEAGGRVPNQKSVASRNERGAMERPFTCSFTNGDRVPIDPAIFNARQN